MSKSDRRTFLAQAAPLAAASLLLPSLASDIFAGEGAALGTAQTDWRFCDKCFDMFWDGAANKGRCSAGGGHQSQGFIFNLPYGTLPEIPNGQINWRFCSKCYAMYFDGAPAKGRCAGGGGHTAQGFNFRLPHDIPVGANMQGGWQFCKKCFAMFYSASANKGNCPAGGPHASQGFGFVLPFVNTSAAAFSATDEVHFKQDIVTPPGTALGGFVELWLRSDGTYKAHFHMHDSGEPDYSFTVQAVFTASNGIAFGLQHSGKVQGHIIGDSGRNDEKDIVGSSPFIKPFWPEVKKGHFAVTKQYTTGGVVGLVEDLGKAVLGAAGNVAGGAVSAVIGLGDEITNTFNTLDISGTFGLLSGVVVFAVGGGLALAVTAGATVGRVTKSLIRQRPLTQAEVGFAAKVFGGTLPPANKLIVTNLHSAQNRKFTIPGGGGNIYLNLGAGFDSPTTYSEPSHLYPGQVFIHEMTHAWQIHNGKFLPCWICSEIDTQANNHADSSYKYNPPGSPTTPWGDFNPEQQASIVEQWFAGKRFPGQAPMDEKDDFFHFIRDHIRAGRT